MGGVSPTQAQAIQYEKPMPAISVDVESDVDYGVGEIETARLLEEAVRLLSEAAEDRRVGRWSTSRVQTRASV